MSAALQVDEAVASALTGRRGVVVAVAGDLVTVRWDSDDEFQYTFSTEHLRPLPVPSGGDDT